MESSSKFYDGLITSIEESQANAPSEAATFFASGEFSEGQLIEFLKFQAYYERSAAHNVTGELGAYKSFEQVYDLVPKFVQETIDRIIPDEKFHMKLGKQCIKKYCITEDQQQRVRKRVDHTLVLQQRARTAFNRRMAEAA